MWTKGDQPRCGILEQIFLHLFIPNNGGSIFTLLQPHTRPICESRLYMYILKNVFIFLQSELLRTKYKEKDNKTETKTLINAMKTAILKLT